jgi:hypothetical protein
MTADKPCPHCDQYREVLELIATPNELVEANDVFSIHAFRSAQEQARWALDNLPFYSDETIPS